MNGSHVNEKRKRHIQKTDVCAPWGSFFATTEYFRLGFIAEEGLLVEKYLDRPSDILIIGSGNGREARPICRDGHRIFCTDIGSLCLQSGKRLFTAAGCPNVRFVAADMRHLPFAENSFDFVFFSLYSPAKDNRFDILRDIRRLLRPGGLVLMTAVTPLYPAQSGFFAFDSIDEVGREVSTCLFEGLDGAVDPNRPQYLSVMLRAMDENGKR